MAARLAIARAQRQLSEQANVHLHVRNFAVINTVAAASLRATLNCEAFAAAHAHDAHFDRSSFVGLAWRPADAACCCEAYSTGRMNLPGSRTERSLHASFMRMLPELLRFSSSSRLLEHIPKALRGAQQKQHGAPVTSETVDQREEEEEEEEEGEGEVAAAAGPEAIDDDALTALGL
ncbi:MAG: hypothetical protein ACKVI4_15255 [Actinomycetales bacterium]